MSELTEAVDILVSVYDGSPATMDYVAKRYPGLHHAIESVMLARTRTKDAEDIRVQVEQRQETCDHRYGFDDGSDVYRCTKCHAPAPNEPMDVPVPPTVLLPDLLAAVWRAEAAASAENAKATSEKARTATHGACRALRLLARELASERDGAGAPSPAPSEPDVATDPPAPSLPVLCATEHPTLQFLRCTLVQDHGPAENHYSAVHRVWWR